MTELFLIAHSVRGEAAFDVAVQMECPHCNANENVHCFDCDSLGYWWIIPTSGHRAFPYWCDPLQWYLDELCDVPPMPSGWPGHYKTNATVPEVDITSL